MTYVDDGWWLVRRQDVCLDPNSIYLNTGSFAPLPKPVYGALCAWRRRLAESPSDYFWRQTPLCLDQARSALASYLNADPECLLLLQNTTYGINLVVGSLSLPAGAEIVMTDHEYGAMRYCFEAWAKRRGWSIRQVAIPYRTEDPGAIVATMEAGMGPATRLLFFSHVTSPTGLVLPAAALCAAARARGILTLVDGAHAPGMVPVDLAAIDADFYAGNCHKWLMAPSGAAFLAVRRDQRDGLEPRIISWGWDYDRLAPDADSGWGGSYWARNLEFQGTLDRTPLMVLPEVLAFRRELGDDRIYTRVDGLVSRLREQMAAIGWLAVTPASRQLSGAMTAFACPRLDVVKARDWIWRTHRIEAPFTSAAGECFLRVSTAWFNTGDEIDAVVAAAQSCPIADLQ